MSARRKINGEAMYVSETRTHGGNNSRQEEVSVVESERDLKGDSERKMV